MSTPSATLTLCAGVRLDNSYRHSIYFADRESQRAYFESKKKLTFTVYSFLRREWTVKVQGTPNTIRACNYAIVENNPSIDSRTYYYFITQTQYINDQTVELTLELDVIQTFLRDVNLLPCFIERMHSPTDNVGDCLVDEDLDTGEFIDGNQIDVELGDLCVMLACTIDPLQQYQGNDVNVYMSLVDGVYGGLGMWAVHPDRFESLADVLRVLGKGKIEGIVNMWMYPRMLIDPITHNEENDFSEEVMCAVSNTSPFVDTSFSKPTEIDGYTPKNKRLLTYPYTFAYVTNNNGSSAVYRYERFNGNMCTVRVYGTHFPDATARLVPRSYKGVTGDNNDEGLTLPAFPTCTWNSDTYQLWLAQNQNQLALSNAMNGLKIVAGAGMIVGGAVTGANLAMIGGGASLAVSGAHGIADQMAQKADRDIQPPQAHGSTSSTLLARMGKHTFTICRRQITKEYARRIDDYFTMFGYKVGRVTNPKLNRRKAFTYVKTNGCNVMVGSSVGVENEYLNRFASAFDRGITFWMDGDEIGNYTLDNSPVEV